MSIIEIIGFITALLGVWLTIRQNILCWLVNIISSVFYCIYFFELKLYADSSLQLFFIGMGVYGWVSWYRMSNKLTVDSWQLANADSQTSISNISIKQLIIISVLVLAVSYLISHILISYTDASLPYADSFCMALSLGATWMTAKKYIENWLIWILTDILYVGIYIYKNSYLTAVLYSIFVILAIAGYREWKKDFQKITS